MLDAGLTGAVDAVEELYVVRAWAAAWPSRQALTEKALTEILGIE